LPENFAARPWVERSARTSAGAIALLAGAVVLALFAARPSLGISAALFAAMAAVGGARTLAGSAWGLELGGSRPVVSTGVRAAAQQLGYLVGAGLGGAVLDARGPSALGVVLSAMFGAADAGRRTDDGLALEGVGDGPLALAVAECRECRNSAGRWCRRGDSNRTHTDRPARGVRPASLTGGL
ncbi:MAG TPA: hypothetical protein VNO79_04915, partial [Actinomycetota bacterium]|nr:hypothetical protein [Actinomycetota bacterium]